MLTIRCTKPEKTDVFFTLLVGETYNVGRKGCEINFPDDQSVSRGHAEISVEHPMANMSDPLLIPTVVVTDKGSKFGTFANDGIDRKSKMAMREALNLSPGDRFKFGLQWNEFKIEYTPLVATPSAVKDQSLRQPKVAIMTLGGHLVQEWCDECDYVVMESLSLTVKVVCALLSAKHIVTPAFFIDLLECAKTKKGRPKPRNYLPELAEKNISGEASFEPNKARSRLFQGKVFLFASNKAMRKMGVAVKCGGGQSKLLSEVSSKDVVKEKYLIIKPSERDMLILDSSTKHIIDTYSKTKRFIHDSELGLAAVYVNTEKHCNPYHNFIDSLLPKIASQSQKTESQDKVIIPETQNQPTQLSINPDGTNIVEETFADSVSASVHVKEEPLSEPVPDTTSKRELDPKIKVKDEPPSKKRPAEHSLSGPASREKRVCAGRLTQKGSERSLSAIFGLSDDEDEDDVVLAPSSQDRDHEDVFSSETMDPRSGSIAPEPSSGIDVIPASPEVSDTSITELEETGRNSPVFKAPSLRSTRSTAKPKESESQHSQASASSSGGSKRKRQTPELSPVEAESQSSKKSRTTSSSSSSSEPDALSSKVEKLIIKTEIKESQNNDVPAPAAVSEVSVHLLKGKKIEPKVQVVDGKSVKNFKSFRKVMPLALQQNNGNVTITSSGSSRVSSTTSLGGAKLTFEVYEYSPSTRIGIKDCEVRGRNVFVPPQTSEAMELEDVMPEESVSGTNTRSRRTRATQQEEERPQESHLDTVRRLQSIFPPDQDDDEDEMFQF